MSTFHQLSRTDFSQDSSHLSLVNQEKKIKEEEKKGRKRQKKEKENSGKIMVLILFFIRFPHEKRNLPQKSCLMTDEIRLDNLGTGIMPLPSLWFFMLFCMI